jgi:hypothetical protein
VGWGQRRAADVLAAIAVGILVWALRTAAGSAWVVTLAPQ